MWNATYGDIWITPVSGVERALRHERIRQLGCGARHPYGHERKFASSTCSQATGSRIGRGDQSPGREMAAQRESIRPTRKFPIALVTT